MNKDKRETNIPFTSPSKWKERTAAWCKLIDHIREFKADGNGWQMAHLREKERYLIPFSDSLKKCLDAIENSRCSKFEEKYHFPSENKFKKILIRYVPSLSDPDGQDQHIRHKNNYDKLAMDFLEIPWDKIKPKIQNDEERFLNTEDFP
jgi:hypothetical protein